jgi:hypothetical protein
MEREEKVFCDFCNAGGIELKKHEELLQWRGGEQGKIFVIIPCSGFFQAPIKHACPDTLCQARLLVWTRS